MIAAARAGRLHYKKRPTPPQSTKKPKRAQSSSNVLSTTNHRNSLAVPGQAGLRKRSGSVPAIQIATLASEWNLKPNHIRALKISWARLCEPPRSQCKGIVALVERVWCKLDTKDPSIREIFYKAAFVDGMNERVIRRRSQNSIATLRDHTHFFVSLVSQIVQSLEKPPEEMLSHLDKIGRNHAYLKQYGFRSSQWEKVGEYFVDTVVVQDCVRGYPEACRAWTLLVAAIVDRLRAAPRRGSDFSVGREQVNVQPVRIFGSGNVFCPQVGCPRSPRGSCADIYHGMRRGSSGELKADRTEAPRRSSGGELTVDNTMSRRASCSDQKLDMSSLSIQDTPTPRRSSYSEVRMGVLKEVTEPSVTSSFPKCFSSPLSMIRAALPGSKSSSAVA